MNCRMSYYSTFMNSSPPEASSCAAPGRPKVFRHRLRWLRGRRRLGPPALSFRTDIFLELRQLADIADKFAYVVFTSRDCCDRAVGRHLTHLPTLGLGADVFLEFSQLADVTDKFANVVSTAGQSRTRHCVFHADLVADGGCHVYNIRYILFNSPYAQVHDNNGGRIGHVHYCSGPDDRGIPVGNFDTRL